MDKLPPPPLRVGSLSPVPSSSYGPCGCLYLASFATGGPGSEMVLCLVLAVPSAGSGHSLGAGAGRLHAGLCHHAGPVACGWPPSARGPELCLAGSGAQPGGVLSVGTNRGHGATAACSPLWEHAWVSTGTDNCPHLPQGQLIEVMALVFQGHTTTPFPLPPPTKLLGLFWRQGEESSPCSACRFS